MRSRGLANKTELRKAHEVRTESFPSLLRHNRSRLYPFDRGRQLWAQIVESETPERQDPDDKQGYPRQTCTMFQVHPDIFKREENAEESRMLDHRGTSGFRALLDSLPARISQRSRILSPLRASRTNHRFASHPRPSGSA